MIGSIRGRLLEKNPPQILVETNGVGYEIDVPMSTLYNLPDIGAEVFLYTHYVVREDAELLFGFSTKAERSLFRLLIRISGIGPKIALSILSGISASILAQAVSQAEPGLLTRIPGVGKKTAERIVLELQDKIGPVAGGEAAAVEGGSSSAGLSGILAETLAALTSLGYSEQEVLPVAESHLAGCTTVEQLLKETLKALGSGR